MPNMQPTHIIAILLSFLAAIAPVCHSFGIRSYASPNPVIVNSSANLTCQLSMNGKPKILSMYWGQANTSSDVSENCVPYDLTDFSVWCDHPENSTLATIFILTIKRVLWRHRGDWSCKYATDRNYTFLDVVVPAKIESFTVSPAYKSLDAALTGDGTLASPYDLTRPDSQGLNLTCTTSCSYPYVRPLISFNGVNVQQGDRSRDFPPGDWAASGSWSCGGEAAGQVGGVTRALVTNCSALGLDGKTKFSCLVGNYSRQIYIMCPEIERQYPLTQGEIAAASVGSVLALFLVGLGFALFCRAGAAASADDSDGGSGGGFSEAEATVAALVGGDDRRLTGRRGSNQGSARAMRV